jgi:SAM-dependent methyltransferase
MQGMTPVQYDKLWATKWGDANTSGPFHRHLRRIIKRLITPLEFETVLDAGCGQGTLLRELRAEFPHIKLTGTDISPLAIDLARQTVPEGKFWVLDSTKEHLDERFDLIVCSEVLEHIPDDVAALSHIAEMTGKYLLISSPQGRMRRFEPKKVGHVRNYAQGELVRKVEQVGLRVIKVVEWGFPFYSPLYRNVMELTDGRGTTGEIGWRRRVLAEVMYYMFMLNSWRRGDEIVVLAERSDLRSWGR